MPDFTVTTLRRLEHAFRFEPEAVAVAGDFVSRAMQERPDIDVSDDQADRFHAHLLVAAAEFALLPGFSGELLTEPISVTAAAARAATVKYGCSVTWPQFPSGAPPVHDRTVFAADAARLALAASEDGGDGDEPPVTESTTARVRDMYADHWDPNIAGSTYLVEYQRILWQLHEELDAETD